MLPTLPNRTQIFSHLKLETVSVADESSATEKEWPMEINIEIKKDKDIENLKKDLQIIQKKQQGQEQVRQPSTQTITQTTTAQAIKALLTLNSIVANEQNLALVKEMLLNNIPPEKNNLQKAKQLQQLFNITTQNTAQEQKATNNTQKTIFMLKNQLPINQTTATVVDNIAAGKGNLTNLFETLAQTIENIPSQPLKQSIINILLNQQNSETKNQALIEQKQSVTAQKQPITEQTQQPKATEITQKEMPPTQKPEPTTTQQTQQKETAQKEIATQQKPEPNTKETTQRETQQQTQQKEIPQREALQQRPTFEQTITKEPIKEPIKAPIKEAIKEPQKEVVIKQATKEPTNTQTQQPLPKPLTITPITPQTQTTTTAQLLAQTYSLELNAPKEQIDTTIIRLTQNIKTALELLSQTQTQTQQNTQTSELLQTVRTTLMQISTTIDFVHNLQDVVYIPLPLLLNQNQTNGEIYLFKDRNKKNTKSQDASALISLNTLNLGKVEAYIQRAKGQISLQFRLEQKTTEQIIKQNLPLLQELLKVSSVTFVPLKEPFNIITSTQTVQAIDLEQYNFDAMI